MKKSLVILFAAVAFLASCQMSEIIPGISKDLKVFTGTLEDNATRVALIGDGDVYHVTWNLGDRIWINDEYEFTATVGDVTTTYFAQDTTGDRPDDPPTAPYKAFWPSNVSRGLPGVQNYVPNSIEFIPMAAESGDEILPYRGRRVVDAATGVLDTVPMRDESASDVAHTRLGEGAKSGNADDSTHKFPHQVHIASPVRNQ